MLLKIRYSLFCFLIIFTMFILTPVVILRPFNSKNSNLFFKVFAFFSKVFLRIEVIVEGKEHIINNRPGILIGNHQHNFDVITVTGIFTPFIVILGKFELGLIPYFGQFYLLSGNILVKRGHHSKAMKSMEMVYKKLNDKKLSVLIFPEGHRNQNKELLPFKKGAYHTAVSTGFPLIPFSVSQFAHHDNFNNWKYKKILIKVHPPISVVDKTKKDIPELIKESKAVIETGIKEVNHIYQ